MTRIVVLLEKLLFKSLLPQITFVNCKSSYLVKGFLHNLSLCFDVACAQLWVNAEEEIFFNNIRCKMLFSYNWCTQKGIKETGISSIASCKVSLWKNINNKGKRIAYLIYNIVSLGNHTWLEKQNLSIEKKGECSFSQIVRRFIPWENSLRLFWMTLNEAFICLWTFSNSNYTRKSSHPIKSQRLKL